MNDVAKKNSMIINARINEVLNAKDMQQKELAEKSGIRANTISYFVNKARIPNVDQLVSIAKALNVSTDYLLGLTNTMSTDIDHRRIADYTGLSDVVLQEMSEDSYANIQSALNTILSLKEGKALLRLVEGYIRSIGAEVYGNVGQFVKELDITTDRERAEELEDSIGEGYLHDICLRTEQTKGSYLQSFNLLLDYDLAPSLIMSAINEKLILLRREYEDNIPV